MSAPTPIQLHRLEGFYWVAKTGGYARAARAFPYPITQPAVHQQVKKLEDELDVTLFERVAKDRMAPTPAGQRLFDFIRPFFEGLPSVVRSVRGGEYGGSLRVSSSPLLLRHLLPAWVRRLQSRHPEVVLHLEETSSHAVTLLRQGAVDIAIDHLYEQPDDIAAMKVATLDPIVVLPADHPAVTGESTVKLSALGDTPFVFYDEQQQARELQATGLQQLGLTPPSSLSGTSAETILGFVAAGLGWSFLPWLGPEGPDVPGVVSMPLTGGAGSFEVVAAWRKDAPANPLLDAMLEAASED